MTKNLIQFIVLFVVLVLVQIIFSKVVLFSIATPIIFIYLLMRLPIGLSLNIAYTVAFFMGLTIDMFNNTQGMNALACLLMTAVRTPVFNAYIPHDDETNNTMPSTRSLGIPSYLKYMGTLVLIYCTLIFFIQAFTLHNIFLTIGRIIGSSILSGLLIFGIDSLVSTHREKRL